MDHIRKEKEVNQAKEVSFENVISLSSLKNATR